MTKKKSASARMRRGRDIRDTTPRGPLQKLVDGERGRLIEVDGVAFYDTKGCFDPTIERVSHLTANDELEYVDPAKIDSSEQPIGRTPRIRRVSHLDRWHTGGIITQRQWWAGDAYRKLYEGMQSLPRVVASYGERTSAGEPDYGLARSDAQARRRVSFRHARGSLHNDLVGIVDRMLLRNDLPAYRGRKQMSAITLVRKGLDALADHFEHRRADQSLDDRNTLG